jgi:hypothetical protein
MAKPNYSFAKRQRDLAKKQKKAEKLERRQQKTVQSTSRPEELSESPADYATKSVATGEARTDSDRALTALVDNTGRA